MSHFLWVISMIHSKLEEHTCNLRDFLRVVQIEAILFLKSMSERDGSDIQRLWNSISRSTPNRLKMMSFKFTVVLCRIRLFPTLVSKIKRLGSELPLIRNFWLADFLLHFMSWFIKFVLNNVFIFLSIPSFDFQKVVCCLKNCYTRISYQLEHFK